MNRWKERVAQGYSATESVESFFSNYMKGDNAPDMGTLSEITSRASESLQAASAALTAGNHEAAIYEPFVKYLQKVVAEFPSNNKPIFANTSSTTFPRLHPTDHDSKPDVTGSLPQLKAVPKKWEWKHAATVLEFKFKDDPINDVDRKPNQSQLADLVQLIQNARRILMVSGCCYSFVVSVFGRRARLFRVDRSGYIVTVPFDWTTNAEIFPEFYWRLYNGGEQGRVLGADITISIPTKAEKRTMFTCLLAARLLTHMTESEATDNSRWIGIKIDGKLKRCFTLGEPIFQSKGLFCRGTRVDRVIIDGETPAQVHVLKDAWQQACRLPESAFYAVIKDYVAEKYDGVWPVGLAAFMGHYDLGFEYPDHRTITAALRNNGNPLQDRSHHRILTMNVGFGLDKYPNTLSLVQAIRDAINGHRVAYEAGVLHRDVSVGNILLDEHDLLGFLHDFDYSEFTPEGWKRFRRLFPDTPNIDIDKNLKDMTGTYPFLAIDLLRGRERNVAVYHECKHDLESFYWILMWILLRHADHSDPTQEYACYTLFDHDSISSAIYAKSGWLHAPWDSDSFIRNNPPLSRLVDDLNLIFYNQSGCGGQHTSATGDPATHSTVLAVLQTACEATTWPNNDRAKPFIPPRIDHVDDDLHARQQAGAIRLDPGPFSLQIRSLPASLVPDGSQPGRVALATPLAPSRFDGSSTSDLKRRRIDVGAVDVDELDDAEVEKLMEKLRKRQKKGPGA
ncbi:hypothetical protein C8R43DRAFT_1243997 [Mycena crocata]|nr:hypothetical protein C8R43DRAFT_1243997 [Mycena crocata]